MEILFVIAAIWFVRGAGGELASAGSAEGGGGGPLVA